MISSPSNIALIKYMGKIEGSGNKPTNGSLSYTLEHLRTFIEIKSTNDKKDTWSPLVQPHIQSLHLNEKGIQKFLSHFQFLKEKWNIQNQFFHIQSGNNFPSDCGLASSASSFSALTQASAQIFQKLNPQSFGEDTKELSRLSRKGSGSSCRSFYSPWALWREEFAEPIQLNQRLHSSVIILENGKKSVSSSEAHKRVLTSPRFDGRIQRAEMKLRDLISSIEQQMWKQSFDIIWDELWDMHELFHTSKPSFTYLTEESREILKALESQWKKQNHGPWITLDAGPNIHLLFNEEDLSWAQKYMTQFNNYTVINSWDSR